MPANLSPEYKSAEEEYRQAKDPQAKLAGLEKMLSAIPKHKGTEKMQADLKRRIKKLREGLQKKGAKKGFSVTVDKEGAAQVVLIGAPNAGKSALVECATNARTEVADYPLSTRTPVPGMLVFLDLQFQLVDLPPISTEYMEFWVTDIIRTADSALWVVDAADPDISGTIASVESVLENKKIQLSGAEYTKSRGHDPIRKIPTLVIASKMDVPGAGEGLDRLRERFEPDWSVLPLSALGDSDFDSLGSCLVALNRIIRVYAKTPGKEANREKPFVLHEGDRLIDFARIVHKDFAAQLRFARVWGQGKFDGQRIQRDQVLVDGDVVELHM